MQDGPLRIWRDEGYGPYVLARADDMDVGMMTARDVATAMCMRKSTGTPSHSSTSSSTGTTTIPPPTPSRPARMPTKLLALVPFARVSSQASEGGVGFSCFGFKQICDRLRKLELNKPALFAECGHADPRYPIRFTSTRQILQKII